MIFRKPLGALGLLSLTMLVSIGVADTASAAQTCELPPDSSTCFSSSTDTVVVEQPVEGRTEDVETFKTRVIVQGPKGITYDEATDQASDSSAAADLTADAAAAASAAGLQITSTTTSPPQRSLASSTQTEVTTPDRKELSAQSEVIVGPATAMVGPDRSEALEVPAGAVLVNTNIRTTEYVFVTTNTTNTYLTTATITVTAVAPAGPSTTSTTTPSAAAAPASTDTSSGELARTGTSNGPWTALGITLVLAGAGCLHLSRRTARREQPLPR